MSTGKSVVIKAEMFWSRWMTEHNTTFGDNNKYECTLGNISDADVQKLETLGIRVKNKDSMGHYIVAKTMDSKTYNVKDKAGKPVDTTTIGNGTKVTVKLTSYEHRMTSKYGMAPSVRDITVDELLTYNPEAKTEELNDVL